MSYCKKCLVFSFIILISLPNASCQKERIELGERESFTIESYYTGRNYNVDVRLPVNYNQNESYSTIYLLDSDWYFSIASEESAKQTMDANHKGVIVVGIRTHNSRSTDFTPTATSQGEGGASEFTGFLNDELIPEIEKKYSVAKNSNRRSIIGHSLGGLFAIYLFVHHNDLFNNYYALSPSLWYDEAVILKDEKDMRAQNQDTSIKMFISIAELEPTQLFIEIFYENINSYYPNIVSKKLIVKGKNHSSSADKAITEAIEFYFDKLEGVDL